MRDESYRKLRVFVASPTDVRDERSCLKTIVSDLNQTGGIADQMRFFLEVLDWSTHATPDMGRPEEVILKQLPVKKWDLFIGILWMRFGTPTGGVDPDTGEKFTSGTEEEFECAYKSWQKFGRPYIQFYRCNKQLTPIEIDWEQSMKVENFFKRFKHDGQRPGLYDIYEDRNDFEKKLRRNLIWYLKEVEKGIKKQEEETAEFRPEIIHPETGSIISDRSIEEELKEGEVYQLAFLNIDIVGSGKIARKYLEKKQLLLTNYHKFIINIVRSYNGDLFSWAGDGGIIAFWGEEAPNNAVLAGVKITQDLTVFNLDRKLNPIEEPIKIRLAGHFGSIEFKVPMSTIFADCINYVSHLGNYGINPETFAITDILLNKIDDSLKGVFLYDKKYEGNSVFVYQHYSKISSTKMKLSESDLEKMLDLIKHNSKRLFEELKTIDISEINGSGYDLIRGYIESIYNEIENFYNCFSDYDSRWSKTYFRKLTKYINSILEEEEGVYHKIEEFCIELKTHKIQIQTVSSLLKFVGWLRINPIPNLKHLLRQFEIHIKDEIRIGYISKKSLMERITKLTEADDFTEEVAFVELFLNERAGLIDYITNSEDDVKYDKLISRLWNLADFIFIYDLDIRKNKKSDSTMIFQVLSLQSNLKNYFSVVLELLVDKNLRPDRELIKKRFIQFAIEPKELDLIIALKCLLVYHSNREFRKNTINNIGINNLWEIISYSKTPLNVIQEICEYINLSRINKIQEKDGSANPNDVMKIFFDLIQTRLIAEINKTDIDVPLFQIKLMIIIFYKFDFFVETGYFERLEELRLYFNSKAKRFPDLKIKDLEDVMEVLKNERDKKGKPHPTIPKGLDKLPLPIQRRLAKQGHYLKHFISNTHFLIALETLRYINLNNIGTILHFRTINSVLLGRLLDNEELFRKPTNISLALNHPKCNLKFAHKNTHILGNIELKKIAQNTNANPEVRNYIKSKLQRKG